MLLSADHGRRDIQPPDRGGFGDPTRSFSRQSLAIHQVHDVGSVKRSSSPGCTDPSTASRCSSPGSCGRSRLRCPRLTRPRADAEREPRQPPAFYRGQHRARLQFRTPTVEICLFLDLSSLRGLYRNLVKKRIGQRKSLVKWVLSEIF